MNNLHAIQTAVGCGAAVCLGSHPSEAQADKCLPDLIWEFPKIPHFGVLLTRILLFRVLY